MVYATWWVRVLGEGELGKLCRCISCFMTSSIVSPCLHLFFKVSKFLRINCNWFCLINGSLVVLWRCWRSWCRWPCTVAMLIGRCFSIKEDFSPGHVMKLFFLIAVIKVDVTGGKHAACKYCASVLCACFLRIITFNFGVYEVRWAHWNALMSCACCCANACSKSFSIARLPKVVRCSGIVFLVCVGRCCVISDQVLMKDGYRLGWMIGRWQQDGVIVFFVIGMSHSPSEWFLKPRKIVLLFFKASYCFFIQYYRTIIIT